MPSPFQKYSLETGPVADEVHELPQAGYSRAVLMRQRPFEVNMSW